MIKGLRLLFIQDPNAVDTPSSKNLTVKFVGRTYFKWLSVTAAVLVLLNLIALVCKYKTGHPNAWGIIPQFILDEERNIPTYFSCFLLLLAAVLLLTVSAFKARQKDKFVGHWRLLSFIFLYMSVDEASGIHEMLIYPLRDYFHFTGVLYFSWVIVGVVVMAAVAVHYFPFLVALKPRLRGRMFAAAVVYVGGALGIEFLGGYYFDTYGGENLVYGLITTIEETMEMAGVLILIFALYKHLERHLSQVTIQLNDALPVNHFPEAANTPLFQNIARYHDEVVS